MAIELDVAVDAFGIRIQRVGLLHHRRNEHGQSQDDEDVDGNEEPVEQRMPSQSRVAGSDDPLSKHQIHNEQQQDAGGHEDVSGDGDADVAWIARPYYAHDLCDYSCHAETEEHGRHDEFVAAPSVDLEYCHVAGGTNYEENDEDAAYWYIDSDRGKSAQGSVF